MSGESWKLSNHEAIGTRQPRRAASLVPFPNLSEIGGLGSRAHPLLDDEKQECHQQPTAPHSRNYDCLSRACEEEAPGNTRHSDGKTKKSYAAELALKSLHRRHPPGLPFIIAGRADLGRCIGCWYNRHRIPLISLYAVKNSLISPLLEESSYEGPHRHEPCHDPDHCPGRTVHH